MNVPAFAANETTTIRHPKRRKAGISLAIDKPAKVSIGVMSARKLIFPVNAFTCAAHGNSGDVNAIATKETQHTAGIFLPVARFNNTPASTAARMITMPGNESSGLVPRAIQSAISAKAPETSHAKPIPVADNGG